MIDLHYFGNIKYYKILNKNKDLIFNTNTPFCKGWFSNKTEVIGSNGIITLTVPIAGGRNKKQILKDVKIAYNENWQLHHKKVIYSCYGNAPFFEFYKHIFDDIFSVQKVFLVDLNFYILEKVNRILKLNWEMRLQENEFINGKMLLANKQFFEKKDILFNIKYEQVFEGKLGFHENLSIIDLLFCKGPEAKELILRLN